MKNADVAGSDSRFAHNRQLTFPTCLGLEMCIGLLSLTEGRRTVAEFTLFACRTAGACSQKEDRRRTSL